MTRNQTLVGTMLGRIVPVAAILLLIVGAPVFTTPSAWAAIDTFIRIVGVDGASKDPAHMNWITVSSVVAQDLNGDAQADRESVMPSISETVVKSTAPGSGAGGGKAKSADVATGQATGRRMHKPLTIVREIDKASPLLAQACASGKHFAEVDVDLGSGHYKLTDVVISSDTKSGGDRPVETISFTYQKIEMTH
jgi:type VI protein secretion system component Hcp